MHISTNTIASCESISLFRIKENFLSSKIIAAWDFILLHFLIFSLNVLFKRNVSSKNEIKIMVEDKKNLCLPLRSRLSWAAQHEVERKKLVKMKSTIKFIWKVSGKVFHTDVVYKWKLFICCTKIQTCKCLCSSIHLHSYKLFILTKLWRTASVIFCCFRIISHDTLTVSDVMTESCFFTYFSHSQLWKKEMNGFFCTYFENGCDNDFILGLLDFLLWRFDWCLNF